ncbi:MAG TPA: flavin reductase family protein [Solirubrobacterales bacterium]|nr:flavin reductase family protein [Solirubrobacterales bacterium]
MTAALQRPAAEEFRDVIGHFATGVTIVTARHEDTSFGTTASAVCSLSLEPPMLLVCMNKASQTGQAIEADGRFAVNILSEEQPDLAKRFARKGGAFDDVPVEPGSWGEPLLSDALATLECHVAEEVTGGTHTVFIAEVGQATVRRGLAPLAYFRGRFHALGALEEQELIKQKEE